MNLFSTTKLGVFNPHLEQNLDKNVRVYILIYPVGEGLKIRFFDRIR